MYVNNKQRNGRLTLNPKEKFLIGPQFTLQASATAVQERPPVKRDLSVKNLDTFLNSTSSTSRRPVSYVDGLIAEPISQQYYQQQAYSHGGGSGSSGRRPGGSTTAAFVYDLASSTGDNRTGTAFLMTPPTGVTPPGTGMPGSKMAMAVPVISRTSEERATSAERLNLDRRQLTACPLLDGEDQLRLLNYQHNVIRRIENLGALSRLIFLDFYDNQIEQISGLDSLKSLRVLMLGKNRIKKIENLEALEKLDVLDLHGNQIRQVENLNHLSDLRVLNLAGNQIESVCYLRGMDSLTELNLRRNNIRSVSEADTLPNLQRLFLSFNSITSFDDIGCVSDVPGLTELCLDGNPMCQDLSYKQTILRHVRQLKQLDMKRITDDERRIALVVGRKEEEKRKETSKILAVQDKRRQTINNARHQWEVEQQQALRAGVHRRDSLMDLHAMHVGNVPNTDRSDVSMDNTLTLSSGRPSSTKSHLSPFLRGGGGGGIEGGAGGGGEGGEGGAWMDRPKSVGPSIGGGGDNRSNDRTDPRFANDCLSEIDGDTLNLYGSGALDAFERSWGMQAAGSVTTVTFEFIDFREIAKVLHKIRIRFPNVVSLVFGTTNIMTLAQLNAFTAVRRLDSITLQPDGNPVTKFVFWRSYLIFRLAHFSLKKINGIEVGVADIVTAEKFFAVLANTVSTKLPHARLASLLGDKKKQLLTDERMKKNPTEVSKIPTTLEKVETIGRAVLAYTTTESFSNKLQESRPRRAVAHTYVHNLSAEAIQASEYHRTLVSRWQDILSELVRVAVLEMWDINTYTRNSLAEIETNRQNSQQQQHQQQQLQQQKTDGEATTIGDTSQITDST